MRLKAMNPKKKHHRSKELECSICGSDMDLEGEGGIAGEFGICPVAFCEWCFSSLQDMFEKIRCVDCEYKPEEEE